MLKVLVGRDDPVEEPRGERQGADSCQQPGVALLALLDVEAGGALGDEFGSLADLLEERLKIFFVTRGNDYFTIYPR